MNSQLKIVLIGCGAIGTRIAQAIDQQEVHATLIGVADLERKKAKDLIGKMDQQCPRILNLDNLFDRVNLIVEAASAAIVHKLLSLSIQHKTDCMIMSIGGLLQEGALIEKAQGSGIKIYCPSGAVAGLDAVAAASTGRIDRVLLTTRKPPQGLKGAPYVIEKGIDLNALEKEQVIFEGNALEAVNGFPKNINVAAALSLAGVGPVKTTVRIVADPKVTRNSHQIEVEGEFGTLVTRTENLPSPFNPRTSYLAALSAVACLKKITSALRIGG